MFFGQTTIMYNLQSPPSTSHCLCDSATCLAPWLPMRQSSSRSHSSIFALVSTFVPPSMCIQQCFGMPPSSLHIFFYPPFCRFMQYDLPSLRVTIFVNESK